MKVALQKRAAISPPLLDHTCEKKRMRTAIITLILLAPAAARAQQTYSVDRYAQTWAKCSEALGPRMAHGPRLE